MARIDLRENEYMERFVSQNHIDSNDAQFWYQLLSCSFNFMRVQDPKIVDKTLDPYLVRLTLNNKQSLNIGSLLRVFLDRVSRIKSQDGNSTNSYYVFQSFNALYLIRSICKSYIENLSEEQLIKAFRAQVDPVVVQQAAQMSVPPPSFHNPTTIQQQQVPIVQSTPASPLPDTVLNQQNSKQNLVETVKVTENQVETANSIANVALEASSTDASVAPASLKVQTPKEVTSTLMSDVSHSAAQSEPQQSAATVPSKKSDITPGASMLDQYISTLIAIIVDIPLLDSTYLLQVESINALLVLLSVQLYSTNAANQSVIYRCLMQKKCSIHALILTKTLLNNFVSQKPMPQETGSIILGIASGLWKVLTLGYGGGPVANGHAQDDDEIENIPLLARQSLLLLNILTNHYTSEKNPYREAIVNCQDSRYNLSDPQMAFDNANNDAMATATTSKSVLMSNSIKIDFCQLYDTICKNLHNDQVALLLYLLLHSNKIFRPYILTTASKELDRLLLPLLRILYLSIEKGSHHVYMVLIIFIILSEESSFNESIHKINIRGVPWYKDRILSEISLGSLTTLIIVRSFQYNTFRIKDKFLHTNLFATLANLSNHFQNLHPYVCQRVVDLLERLSKRYLSASSQGEIKSTNVRFGREPRHTLDVLNSNNPLAKALATDTQKQNLQDASSIELDSTAMQAEKVSVDRVNISIPDQQHQPPMMNNSSVMVPAVDQHGQELKQSVEESKDNQLSSRSNSTTTEHVNISMEDSKQDLSLIEEVIRMILEVINNSLSTQLRGNPDLIYTLLYKRSVFSSLLASHQSFYTLVINVERILTYFYNKIEAFERPLSVGEIKELIESESRSWNYDQNRDPNTRLLFHYVEDEQPEEFFIPYIWTRIYYSSGIVWNSKRIELFTPDEL